MTYLRYPSVAAAVLFSALACSDSPTVPEPLPEVASASIDTSAGPLLRTLYVNLVSPAGIEVVYAANGEVLRVAKDTLTASHAVLLPRLRGDRAYTYSVRALAADGRQGTPRTGEFRTSVLPAALADLRFEAHGTPTHPLTIIELAATASGFTGVLIVDEAGEIVWYRAATGSVFGSTRRANGNIILLDPTAGLVEVRPDGHVARQLEREAAGRWGRIHHAVLGTPHNTVYFIANETRSVDGMDVVGEAIWEWNPEAGTVDQRWSAFDFLSYSLDRGGRSDPSNWLHGNGLALGERGNVLFSGRNADLVVSIAPDFRALEWKIGNGPGALALAPEDRPWGQHSVTALPGGGVLLFDNGFGRPGGEAFSRALELTIDLGANAARKTWEFRRTPDVFSPLVSSVQRLDNGNTVVMFGMAEPGSGNSVEILEVSEAAEIVRRMTGSPAYRRVYRVTPLESIAGEEVVEGFAR
jgi:hypothetical protein